MTAEEVVPRLHSGYYRVPLAQGPDGDAGWSQWQEPRQHPTVYKLACCDCGLVHDMQFRVEDGRVQFRVRRNERSTGQVRRRHVERLDFPDRLVDAVRSMVQAYVGDGDA